MKRSVKRIVLITVVVILMLTIAVGVSADTGKIQKYLSYNNIKITLNGNQITPKDANGNIVEPFIIDGTTYLPVRAVADALGLNVQWDGTTNTVSLSNQAVPVTNSNAERLICDYQGIQIYYRGMSASSSFVGGYDYKLRIVNNSGQNITVQARDESVNGIMADSLFSVDVSSGKTAIDEITIPQYTLDKIGVSKVDYFEFKLLIFNSDSWDDIYLSDIISLK